MAEVKRSTRRTSKKYLKIKARSRRKHLKTKDLLGEISECNEIKEQLLVGTSEFEGFEKWLELGTPTSLLSALCDVGFTVPTEIQELAIPPAIKEDKDVIGAAETGSGKTLAYAIPVLTKVLSVIKSEKEAPRRSRKTKCRGGPPKAKKWKSNERKIIDLNEVIHSFVPDQTEPSHDWLSMDETSTEQCKVDNGELDGEFDYGDDGDDKGEDDGEDDGEDEDNGEGEGDGEDDGEPDGNSDGKDDGVDDGVDGGQEMEGGPKDSPPLGQCTYFRDNIPEEEFSALLQGDSFKENCEEDQVAVCEEEHTRKGPLSIIIVPTRELALQVRDHVKLAAQHTSIVVVAVVGGMASQKQERQLQLRPHVVVATPGRLWKFISEGDEFLTNFGDLQTIVLDEADRMIEEGHFRELKLIMDRIKGGAKSECLQRFLFSATLTMKKKSFKKRTVDTDQIGHLISQVGIRRDHCATVDLSRKHLLVKTLTEAKITCIEEDKDVYLYYLLLMYPRRTLVFTNTIDQLKKLKSLLELLNLHPHCLHAGMQQKQRLKNLERFVSAQSGLLLASDVAARGLDISKIEHIIHYQVPKNPDVYVHRSGRTARATSEGLSLMLVGPRDVRFYHQICKQLNKDEDLPTFPVKAQYLQTLRKRVLLAQKIEKIEHTLTRQKMSDNWLVQSAKALELDLDDSLLKGRGNQSSRKDTSTDLRQLKDELQRMFKKPLIPKGFSMKFPTFDDQHIKLGFTDARGFKEKGQAEMEDKTTALELAKSRKRKKFSSKREQKK